MSLISSSIVFSEAEHPPDPDAEEDDLDLLAYFKVLPTSTPTLPAASAFHQRLSAVAAATTNSGAAIAGSIDRHKVNVNRKLRGIDHNLKKANSRLGDIEYLLERRDGYAGTPGTSVVGPAPRELSDLQKDCLRAISRLEQLFLEEEPDDPVERARQNNTDLEVLRDNRVGAAAQAAFEKLGKSREWTIVSATFADVEQAERERSVRLHYCQELRRAVLSAAHV
jgi:hypothetical protein